MVFYRKYRPQNFEQLIGQDHVKTALLSAFQNNKLAHAYLFVGPRGSGKTSTARILAKLVNCESANSKWQIADGQEADSKTISHPPSAIRLPCNTCSACLSITDGSNLDLIEIDAASNRGIDDIRDLREKIKLSPSSLKKKVYIIDEVHMLTTEAFNALLKTLEEPPAHVLFILATTEVGKLPATILSRVQRFDFKLATKEQVFEVLDGIAKKEGLKIEKEVVALIASVAEGSFRDAVKLLDQVASQENMTLEETRSLISASSNDEVLEFISLVFNKEGAKALGLIQVLNEKGANIKEFTNSILRVLREIMLLKNGVGEGEKLKDLVSKISDTELIKVIENIQGSLEQLKFSSIQSLPLEVAVVKSAKSSSLIVNRELQNQTDSVKSEKTVSDVRQTINDKQIPKDLNPDPIPSVSNLQTSDDIVIITDKWTYILETIRPYNYSLEALLKQAKVLNCDGVNVILEVPYSFHQRILEAPKSRSLLESVLADVLGKSVKVATVLGKRPTKVEELANVELAQDDEIIQIAAEIFNS